MKKIIVLISTHQHVVIEGQKNFALFDAPIKKLAD
jgi:hypothetical protein